MTALLPRPVGRQKEVLALPTAGHTVVLGTAGSGKTTLAIHRAAYLGNPSAALIGPSAPALLPQPASHSPYALPRPDGAYPSIVLLRDARAC